MDLLEKIQTDSFEGYERNIDVHIKNLRKKNRTRFAKSGVHSDGIQGRLLAGIAMAFLSVISIVKALVQAHKGEIEIQSLRVTGTWMSINE